MMLKMFTINLILLYYFINLAFKVENLIGTDFFLKKLI
jgi:hypothetical protein